MTPADVTETLAQRLRIVAMGGDIRPIWEHLSEPFSEHWRDQARRFEASLAAHRLVITPIHPTTPKGE